MLNLIAVIVCAFISGINAANGDFGSFALGAFLTLANAFIVWHHYSKHKEHNP